MPTTTKNKKVKLTLSSSVVFNKDGKFVGGGIENTRKHVDDEMWVEILEDPVMDRGSGQMGVTGRPQIHIGSTRRALEEFAVFLLSLAHYHPPSPGYKTHFDLTDHLGQPALHLVVHLPEDEPGIREQFATVHNVVTAIIDEDGKVHDTTLPPLRDTAASED